MNLRVATLNIWGLPAPFANDQQARLRSLGRRISELELDVIAFQEVWTGQARDWLVKSGRRAGLSHASHSGARIGGSGLLTLSRLPIESESFEAFALGGHPEELENGEFLSGKGFRRTRLMTAAGPISILNTHLHARYAKSARHQFMGHRTGQIVQLARRLRSTKDPVIVLGDFNFREDQPDYQVFTGLTGMRDAGADLRRRQPTVLSSNPYRKANKTNRRIDFAFSRSGQEQEIAAVSIERVFDDRLEIDGRPAAYSNHEGVLAEFDLHTRDTAMGHEPNRQTLDLAAQMLANGRAEAQRRRADGRLLAGLGVGCAAVASAGVRREKVNRRRFLRNALKGAAVAAIAPGIGYSLVSEVFVPDELAAFDTATANLAHLGRTQLTTQRAAIAPESPSGSEAEAVAEPSPERVPRLS